MELTPEQIAAAKLATEQAEAAKKAEAAAAKEAKAAEKARVTAEKQAAKEAKAAEKATLAAAKAQEKADKQAAKDAEVAAKAALKEQKEADKAAAKLAKQRPQMPEQHGVRRPGPNGECGKAWALFDAISTAQNAPSSIGQALADAKLQTPPLNEGNVRTEYARWKKFNGLTGKIVSPAEAAEALAAAEAAAKAAPATNEGGAAAA